MERCQTARRRRILWIVAFFLGMSELLLGPAHGTEPSPHHPPANLERFIQRMEDPGREDWQKPEQVVAALDFKGGETVADIGAGTGYFSVRFSDAVGREKGQVLAIDVDPGLVAYIRERAKRDHLTNVRAMQGETNDPNLSPSSVDLIFFCNVAHHLADRPAYYRRLQAALKPGGRLVIVDFHQRGDPVGPPVAMKLSREQVLGEVEEAGYQFLTEHDFLPYQYFLVFQP